MQLNCRNCGKPIAAADVNIELAIAKCMACNSVFNFADQLGAKAGLAARRPEVPMPGGITVDQWGPQLKIVRRWFSPVIIFLIFFCIAWDSFLVFWYAMAFSDLNGGGMGWMMIIFPVAHVAVGVGLTYFTIAGILNKTKLSVDVGQLTVRHGPLPWPGNRTLTTDELDQLYCTEHISRSGNSTSSSTSYRVNVATRDGKKIKLLSGLSDADQALYIEQKIEEHLGIEDRPVGGEIPR